MKDLIVLTADQDMEFLVKGLLPRFPSTFSTLEFEFEVKRHPRRDPGCRTESHSFLRSFNRQYRYAIVMFDHQGCGKELISRIDLELAVEGLLSKNGWEGKSTCVVIEPELENWVWMNSPHVSNAVGWQGYDIRLYDWLIQHGLLLPNAIKPHQPKEALQQVLRETRKPWSSSIHQQIASQASFRHCTDPAFLKLAEKLREWFSATS